MNVYEVKLAVRVKEWGEKRATLKDLALWVLEKGNAERAVKKAKKSAMKRATWDIGVPVSATLLSVCRAGTIDVV